MHQSIINSLTDFFILVLVVVCIFLIIGILRYRYIIANEFIKEENKKFAMDSSYDPENELVLLDIFIMDCFKSYQTTVLAREDLLYINDDRQVKIIQDLAKMVDERMSDNLRYKLSKYYKEEAINDVMAEKIYSAVVTFVINNNQPK